MERFPTEVRNAMGSRGCPVTCLPVQLDGGPWEAAVFFQLEEDAAQGDRRALAGGQGPVPVGLEVETLTMENAAVVMLRVEVNALPDDPLAGEVLLVPGAVRAHFDTLQRLGEQSRLCWFFGDPAFRVIRAQEHPLEAAQHEEFTGVLQEAVEHDALIRFTGRYDADAALAEVASHYRFAEGVSGAGERS